MPPSQPLGGLALPSSVQPRPG